ncbi:MAG: putative O-glycosylation ligase, exosortase A system-associated [Alphaproteobacteria bacterium]
MRNLFIFALVFATVPAIFAWPYLGVLAWTWISFMNPHRLAFGSVGSFPVAEVVAISTLVAWAISREPKELPLRPMVIMMIVYFGFTTLTTAFAVNQSLAWDKWEIFAKVILFTLVAISLLRSQIRLHALIWVMVASCGYFALKGGLFTALTGGNYLVFGPPGTFHGDNNGIAITFLMLLPLVRYLQMQTDNRFASLSLMGAQVLILIAILGTHSRGALVALIAMFAFMLIRSRHIGLLFLMLISGVVAFNLMPSEWRDRQLSTLDYEEDASAQGRITMWIYAIDVANDHPLLGGGFNVFYDRDYRMKYLPRKDDGSVVQGLAAHSIYFEVLGEHGYTGLLLFLGLWFLGFLTAERVRKRCKDRPDLKWARDLMPMCQASLVAFAVGGAFLNKATFDLYYHLLAVIIIGEILVIQALRKPAPETPPVADPILSYVFPPRLQRFKPKRDIGQKRPT